MLDSQQKRKVNQILYHKVTLVILFVIVLFVLHSTWGVYQKKRESDALKNISLNNKNELEVRDIELKSQLESLNTDAGKEAEIRSKFNVAKNNESIAIIVNDGPTTTMTIQHKSFWQSFWNLFK